MPKGFLGPVKIVIPELVRDDDDSDEEDPLAKKPKLGPERPASGTTVKLLNMLPQPKTERRKAGGSLMLPAALSRPSQTCKA